VIGNRYERCVFWASNLQKNIIDYQEKVPMRGSVGVGSGGGEKVEN